MPTYEYQCDNCDHNFEIQQGMEDKPKKRCPQCHKMKLYRVVSLLYVSVKQEPKTLGHAAQRNTEEMGKYELQAKRQQMKMSKDKPKLESLKKRGILPQNATELPERQKPWYNPEGTDLTKELKTVNTPEKKKEYILEGKK